MADPTALRELPPPLLLNLRGDAGAEAFTSAVAAVLGVAPPVEPNTVAASGDTGVLWLGPDEWLVTAPAATESALAVLAQATSLDLRPRAFGPGRCAQTGLARVPVILQQIDPTPRFRIFVRASFAPYVAGWLQSTIAELAAPG
jgi:sarcosine oxidase subunit gamma